MGDNRVPDEKMTYMVVGEEVGENGTPHRQGFVILKVRTRLSTMKKWIPRGHLELMRGNCKREYRGRK